MNSIEDERPGPITISHEEIIRRGWVASCLNCEEFNKKLSVCSKYGVTPPPEVIVYGCPEWYIEIPF